LRSRFCRQSLAGSGSTFIKRDCSDPINPMQYEYTTPDCSGNATNFRSLPITPTCTSGGLFWSISGCTTQFSESFIGYSQGYVQYGSRAACASSSGSPVSYSVIPGSTGCTQGGLYLSYYSACDDASATLYACRKSDCTDCIVGSKAACTFFLTSSPVLIPIPARLTCERCMQ
jgi:hypothetical protein